MLGWFKKNKKKKQEIVEQDVSEQEKVEVGKVTKTEQPEEIEGEVQVVAEEQKTEIKAAGGQSSETQSEKEVLDYEEQNENEKEKSLFLRLQKGLSRTRSSLVYRLDTLFLGKKEIDQELFDDLEEILITADLGVFTAQELLDDVQKEVLRSELTNPMVLREMLQKKIQTYLQGPFDEQADLVGPEKGPLVIMVVGVNGVGKTTSIGKITAKFVRSGKSVLLVAGDTFRAAAVDQLKIWGERTGVEVIAQQQGADPSSVVYDGIEYGVAHDFDVIIIDTAGRLHTQVNLMEELKKIKRVIGKKLKNAPHEVMLVLDATTGQNGISQAKLFNEAVSVTGITLTKLDGTAKGGIVVNVCRELKIPVRFIGIGEQMDDLRDFDAQEFVNALFYESKNNEE